MTSIALENIFTSLYVWIDDWYKEKGHQWMGREKGTKPRFSNSEMLTLMVMQDLLPYPSEGKYVAYLRANYLYLFPCLVDQSQYNRRARRLAGLVEILRRTWLHQLGRFEVSEVLLDTKPIPVVGDTRNKSHSYFSGYAGYGYCAAKQMNYFGFKFVLVTAQDGVPLVYDLVPANLDERKAAEAVLFNLKGCDVLADKGFIGESWQDEIAQKTGNRIWTQKRANQKVQHPTDFDHLLTHLRRRIETTFHQLQNTGRNIEHLLAKTVQGLCSRIAIKMASFMMSVFFAYYFGFDFTDFSISH